MTRAKYSPSESRRKVDISRGDILLLRQSNGRFSIAYVLGLWPKLEAIMTIALLSSEIAEPQLTGKELSLFVSNEIATRRILAIISTPVAPGSKGEWPKIGTVTGVDIGDLLPSIPFRTDSIRGGKYVSAPMVEGLVEAFRGLEDWNALLPGRPGYLKSLIFSSSTRGN